MPKSKISSKIPESLGVVNLQPSEFQYVQYMPVLLPEQRLLKLPNNLEWVYPMIELVLSNREIDNDSYIYVTSKHIFGHSTNCNRPGWHIDGYLSNDVNFIWYDKWPTEFCVQDFEISEDHELSLKEMESQAKEENVVVLPCQSVLQLDTTNVHRVTTKVNECGLRTFVKISISKNKYNLKGNAKNPLLDYNWEMIERNDSRNHPSK